MRFLLVATSCLVLTVSSAAYADPSNSGPSRRDPSSTHLAARVAGANPLRTDRTIPYWHGQFTDPGSGVSYGYNMAGADPSFETSTTIQLDVIPVDLTFTANGNHALNGTDIAASVLGSPLFRSTDFTSTPVISGYPDSDGVVPELPGGALSAGNSDVQYTDAVMRSEFGKTGTGYHLRLAPTRWPAVSLTVPKNQGETFVNSRGVTYGLASNAWLAAQLQSLLGQRHADPTHVIMFATNDVLTYFGNESVCCSFGFHGAAKLPSGVTGVTNAQGNQPLQTFIYGTYETPGFINPALSPGDKDVTTFTHEVAEWANDPFVTNIVPAWSFPEFADFGCATFLETGDAVAATDFTEPGNTFDAGPYSDGLWHLQDELFLPWFAHQAPNLLSQATQSPSPNVGRYTFMGSLNPEPGFQHPGVC
jgi:hypothetical protein